MDYSKLTKKELLEKIEELEHEIDDLNDYIGALEMGDIDEIEVLLSLV